MALATVTLPCPICDGYGCMERIDVDAYAPCPNRDCHSGEIEIPAEACETCGHIYYDPREVCQCQHEAETPASIPFEVAA